MPSLINVMAHLFIFSHEATVFEHRVTISFLLSPLVMDRVDKPLAQAPTSDVNVMVWHICVPRVQEFGLWEGSVIECLYACASCVWLCVSMCVCEYSHVHKIMKGCFTYQNFDKMSPPYTVLNEPVSKLRVIPLQTASVEHQQLTGFGGELICELSAWPIEPFVGHCQ